MMKRNFFSFRSAIAEFLTERFKSPVPLKYEHVSFQRWDVFPIHCMKNYDEIKQLKDHF